MDNKKKFSAQLRIKSPINKFDKINNKKYQRDSGDNSENYRRNPALITPE